jgi:hypothetical protein
MEDKILLPASLTNSVSLDSLGLGPSAVNRLLVNFLGLLIYWFVYCTETVTKQVTVLRTEDAQQARQSRSGPRVLCCNTRR